MNNCSGEFSRLQALKVEGKVLQKSWQRKGTSERASNKQKRGDSGSAPGVVWGLPSIEGGTRTKGVGPPSTLVKTGASTSFGGAVQGVVECNQKKKKEGGGAQEWGVARF